MWYLTAMDLLDYLPHIIIFAISAIFTLFYWSNQRAFSYWKNKGIPYVRPTLLFGNTTELTFLNLSSAEMYQKLYQQLEGHDYGGVFAFTKPILLLREPDVIKNFMIKDFSHFHDRIVNVDKEKDPLGQHLFSLKGATWRKLRIKLSPTFTSGKMKMMFNVINECANEMSDSLRDSAKTGECLEWKEVAANYTTDVIGSCAFGLNFNSTKDPNSEFRTIGKLLRVTSAWKPVEIFRRLMFTFFPRLLFLLDLHSTPKFVTKFFLRTVPEVMEYREKNNIKRNDFMQLLIQLKKEGRVEDDNEGTRDEEISMNGHQKKEATGDDLVLTDELIAAQAFVFFVAGFDTSSSTVSFCLYELAVNPDVQRRLQEEIDSTFERTNGDISYETVQNMKYLDQVVSETLRKYPILGLLFRECTKKYILPDSKVSIDEGTVVFIPVTALHYDPKYYPEPQRFDPERFSDENKHKIHRFAYLPFGEGPRICIGMRFGLLQVKLGIISLLRKYDFKVCKDTVIPLRMDPASFLTTPTDGISLQITTRSIQNN